MSNPDQVTVSENATVVRDPVTGEAHEVIERTVTETRDSNWALWVAGIAVFATALILALVLLGRGAGETDAEVLAAQAEAEAARLQAEQAIVDANRARMDAAVSGLTAGSSANNAAAASAAAADAARSAPPVVVSPPAPEPEPTGGSEAPYQ